ncbi:beta-ketoacyl synthase N-terminal-like domain-containing protein [Saccharopolyspora elongata]|uniref:Methyltransferase n=1 Tax=Saccharopolyspora elongata TaxID=2530387 RepID=A0A4R4YRC3_9PSEU|nr:beta-ketoacyl synthase N-terminal-like domain-containing protein [Saccharopolyspora elongata]TDD47733.1 methyltransferase [Saccharopolyspora elongata]
MKRLLCDFLWSHLRVLGAFSRSEQTLGAAREAAGLLPVYDLWFAECVRVLEVEGYLERRDDSILVGEARGHRPLDELWREWEAEKPHWQGNPDLAATHLLVETTLRVLPDIVTGKRRATEVMFPGASVELVENAYKSNPASIYFSTALAAKLVAHLRRRADAEAGFEPRILEIGAGTGATSAIVLDAIRAEGLAVREYRYTDLSRAFLEHAERSYGPTSPFLTYGILDIEHAVAEQGIPVGEYDVVIAANVLHATRNIRNTLRNAKAPLKRGGILLLNEVTANNFLNAFTFGLLEGWWLYDDAESRIPGSPLLSVEGWQRVLAEEGYGPVTLPLREATDLGQQIIVAESDGVVRQASTAARESVPDQAPESVERAPVRENPAPVSQSGESAPADRLLDHVAGTVLDVLAESLRIDRSRIARDEPFSNYGLDSIFAVNVARAVGEQLDIDLDITVLFEHGTVAELSEFIVTEYASEIQAPLQPETPGPSGESAGGAPPEVSAPAGAVPIGEEAEPEAMAIVGMSARFPQANDIEEFWRVVEQGVRCITSPPMRRADWALQGDGVDTAAIRGGFMDEIHEFDPLFFGMSMTEARQVTPELRLMLMAAWNAIEDAGYQPAELRTRPTGVFVAATASEYEPGAPDADGGPSLMSSPAPALIPNRISYVFDLHGPSEQCDTTCSSSLVALHRAIRSIRDGECDQALVGGVNLIMSPARFAGMRAAGMLSPSGDVRPFQQDADGTVRSEGAGAVLIKPLSRAIDDGDTIYGVVRGTGVAHGGKGVSFTAPNVRGMKSAIARAYADAGIDPGTVSYVEAHGMSSMLADSAEIAALRASLGGDTAAPDGEDSAIYLGSVKPSIGHTEVFSGLAALVKTVQAVRRGVVPAIPGFGRLHENISLAGTRLRVAAETVPWPVRTGDDGRALPRRASINSFGIGGVNAHAVLEQHLPVHGEDAQESTHSPQILVLSAKTGNALRERARQFVDWSTNAVPENWADVAYTLQVGREAMDCRLALIAATADEAAEVLRGWLDDDPEMRARVAVADGAQRDRGIVDSSADTDEFLRSLVSQRRMDLLADRWVAGASVDWSLLHQGARRRRIPLPGYPFERRMCFDMQSPGRSVPAPAAVGERVGAVGPEDFVTGLVASVLGLEKHEVDGSKALADYGLNSLLLVAVLGRLRGAFPAFQPDWLQPNDTLDDVVARLSTVAADGSLPEGPQFPELVHLNGVTEGRPVFWIHGALASVETYRTIAAKIDRPFYGIQARGFMTEHAPVEGIPKMAEYYTEIIRAVQPEGPYDVGGFCLGGIVSYEITRLLQQQGHAVNSLIMVDSPDGTGLAKSNASGSATARSAAMQVVNSLLWPAGEKDLAEVTRLLIHQDEVDATVDEAELVRRLADLAVERGLSMSREQIVDFTLRNIGVQLAYGLADYEVRPLVDPTAVDCTYFRNRRGLFLGDLEPYFQVASETFSLDHVNYRQDWERELPALRVVDIDAANHMTILHDDGPLAAIEQTCVETYVEGGAA